MEKEIIILCNSQQCLKELSSGLWANMHQRDIFTCNLAYTYFRTVYITVLKTKNLNNFPKVPTKIKTVEQLLKEFQ